MLHMREFNLNLGKELHHLGDCIVVPQDLLQRGPMRGPRLLNTAHIYIWIDTISCSQVGKALLA